MGAPTAPAHASYQRSMKAGDLSPAMGSLSVLGLKAMSRSMKAGDLSPAMALSQPSQSNNHQRSMKAGDLSRRWGSAQGQDG